MDQGGPAGAGPEGAGPEGAGPEGAGPEGAGPEGDSAAAAPVMKLDQFLKWMGVTGSGGQAKVLIRGGEVRVNGETETRRGRKLRTGDRVEVGGRLLVVGGAAPGRSPAGSGPAG
jgi:ribosome-associated protein